MTDTNSNTQLYEIENNLIKEAYAATLDPSRIFAFEAFWEAYIDAETQKNPDGFDWENTPVNAHITIAMDIIGRVRSVNETINEAQHLVESHYGFGFIIDETGRIIVSNTDANKFTSNADYLKDLAIDSLGVKNIMDWLKEASSTYNFFHVYFSGKSRAIPLFISPIKIGRIIDKNAKKHFLITSVETNLSTVACTIIGRSYGLSHAESQVAGMLADGCTPKEVAELRDVKITAVRTQIVKIKEKMSARDIPDIVRKYVSMGLRHSSVKSQINRMEAIRGINRSTLRELSMTLSDGRLLQYFEQGHPKGRIILQIHSLVSGVEFPPNVSRALVSSGYRMISPSRAGFGKSDQNRRFDIVDLVNNAVTDMIQLLDHIGAKDVIILTGLAGAIAQRLALQDRARIKGLVFSGSVPVWEPHYLDYLSPKDRVAVKTSIHAPEALPYLIKVRKALKNAKKKPFFMAGLDKNFKEERDLRNAGAQDYLNKSFQHTIKQGVWAFIEDLPYLHKDWSSDAKQLEIPISIVKGVLDVDQPNEAIIRYMKAVPHAKLTEIEEAGKYLNFTHFNEVLKAIIRIAKSGT